jgi:hypothetical protein
MGLTIHYKLSVEKRLPVAAISELAERAALYAIKIGCVEVKKVARVNADTPFTSLFVRVGREEDCRFGLVPAKRGRVVEVWPGDGCESALFGLCQYPYRIPYCIPRIATGFEGGWLFKGSCKTQYACEHGWDHFLKCHRQIISLLDFWRSLGVAVEVTDEGGYWETRDEKKLRARLESYDGLVAALAGISKDAADDSGRDQSIESPIFARKDFERLEAEGRRELARRLA